MAIMTPSYENMSYEKQVEYIQFLAKSIADSYVSTKEDIRQLGPEEFAKTWFNIFNESTKIVQDELLNQQRLRQEQEKLDPFGVGENQQEESFGFHV